VDGVIRLDLGSGHKKYPGWISVDIADERKVQHGRNGEVKNGAVPISSDVQADLRDLPFPDDYADEARAIHVIEHFYPWEAEDLLKEWLRVLKPGAELAVECPCLEKVLALANVPQCPPSMTYWALYGDPRYKDPLMSHHWCYGQQQLVKVMAQAGFVNLRPEYPQFHQPIRDMRVVGEKPKGESRLVMPE
jgi:predicted SAM-dependent methyltransferase